jgi:tetratricopeptide (TPR) repeat protein
MDVLVEQKIVLNDATKKGYKADSAEVDASLDAQIEQAGSQAVWEAFLTSWGFTEESFRKYMEDIYTIDNYPLTQWNIPEVTEDQVVAEYNERLKTSPNLVYEESKDFIKTTLEVDNEVSISKAWFDNLKASSKIKIFDKRVLGRKAFSEEKYKDAINLYKKAMKSEPDDPYIDVSIAKAYAKLDDAKNVEKYFESAIKKDAKNTFVYMAKAKLLIESEDTAGASEAVKKAVEFADATNLALLERLEELTLQLGMETESEQLDKMIRAIMMPDSLISK